MQELLLVRRGTPAAVDVELDPPVACGISCSLAQGAEESWIEVGYTRSLVIEDRSAVGDGTVSFAKCTTLAERTRRARRTTVLTAKTTVLTARDVGG
jgi:hypothetical protein